jgi:diacylglycerol kinase (CTP)
MKPLFELRRQIAHVLFGLMLITIYFKTTTPSYYLLILFLISSFFSLIAKHRTIPILHTFLLLFEREKHIKQFPGRGLIFFILGAYLSLQFWDRSLALTSILILTLGDAFTNLTGFYFGKRVHFLNKKKTIEGSIGGIIVSTMGAMFFVDFC